MRKFTSCEWRKNALIQKEVPMCFQFFTQCFYLMSPLILTYLDVLGVEEQSENMLIPQTLRYLASIKGRRLVRHDRFYCQKQPYMKAYWREII